MSRVTPAMLHPEPAKAHRGKKGAISGSFVSHQRIVDVRAVLAYSPEVAEAVMRGEKPMAWPRGRSRVP